MKTTAVFTLLSGAAFAALVVDISKTLETRSRFFSRACIPLTLTNNISRSYIAEFTVGPPPQKVVLVVDTGSSDVWMPSSTADVCVRGQCVGKSYDQSKSSTYKLAAANSFTIGYNDGPTAAGDYFTDNLSVEGVMIKSLEMGLGFGSSDHGIAGIGYARDEASLWLTPSNDSTNPLFGKKPFIYPSIMDTMVNQGLINTKAYSIYLNSRYSSTGSIVFGGLDTTKYHGNLIQLPVIPYANSNGTQLYQLLQVNMTGFSINNKNSTTGSTMNSNNNITAILDTGAQVSYLPISLISSIVANLGGIFDSNLDYDNPNPFSGVPFVDCDIRKQQPQGRLTSPSAAMKEESKCLMTNSSSISQIYTTSQATSPSLNCRLQAFAR